MWVLARFAFLGLVFLYRACWRRQGVDQSTLYRGTRRVTFTKNDKLYWGLEFKTPLIFTLTREDGWDRGWKFFGLTTELQTGDRAFDQTVYVAGDHPALHRLLAGEAELRRRIVGLFDRGARRIFSDGAHLWVEPTESAHASDQDLAELLGIRGVLQRGEPSGYRWFSDPFLLKAIAVEALVWTVALYGAPAQIEQLYRSHVLGEEQHFLDLWTLLRPSLLLAAGVFVALMGLVVVVLRGSSRGHRVILEGALVLGICLPLSGLQAITDYSRAQYLSAPRQDVYRVIGKWNTGIKWRNRDNWRRPSYYLILEPRTDGAPLVQPYLKVNSSDYYDAKEGGAVKITSRVGRLNIPWLVRLEVPSGWPLPSRRGN